MLYIRLEDNVSIQFRTSFGWTSLFAAEKEHVSYNCWLKLRALNDFFLNIYIETV